MYYTTCFDKLQGVLKKYPQKIPACREFAKCNKCGHKWYIDGYKDNTKTMLLLRKGFIVAVAVLAFILLIAISSLFDNDNSHTINFENTTLPSTQEEIFKTTDSYQNTTETPTTENIITTANTTTTEESTESTTVSTTKEEETTTTKKGKTVYTTPYGEKYHFSSECAGRNAIERDLNDIKDIYDPCKKCTY